MANMKRKRNRPGPPRGAPDQGPRERWQHGDETLVEPAEEAGSRRVVVLTQDALDRYFTAAASWRRQRMATSGSTMPACGYAATFIARD